MQALVRRSRLESYQDILCALAKKSSTVDEMAYQCNMDCVNLGNKLTFLIENGLAKQSLDSRKRVFSLTRRGNAIYQTLSIAKRLERLQNTAKTMDETIRILPMAQENSRGSVQRGK